MKVLKAKFPKYVIPIFNSWVASCNITIIILISIWFSSDSTYLEFYPILSFVLVLVINIASILFLIPMFKLESIPRFIIPAFIWYVIISTVYLVLGLYLLLIPGLIQLIADIWFDSKLKNYYSN